MSAKTAPRNSALVAQIAGLIAELNVPVIPRKCGWNLLMGRPNEQVEREAKVAIRQLDDFSLHVVLAYKNAMMLVKPEMLATSPLVRVETYKSQFPCYDMGKSFDVCLGNKWTTGQVVRLRLLVRQPLLERGLGAAELEINQLRQHLAHHRLVKLDYCWF